MTLPLYYYVLGTPLGVLGLFRWACWLIRRIPAVLYRPIVNNYRLSMSIVVPVYQEDPVIFAAAIESWLRNRVHEVILVIDASDARCQEIASRYPVTVLITDVPGKRDALRKGWNASSTTPWTGAIRSRALWRTEANGDAYPLTLFEGEAGAVRLEAERQAYMAKLFGDTVGFAGAKIVRRILGLAHNIDFELIEDPQRRAVCEARSLRLARAMLVDPALFPTIAAVTKAAREVRDWQPDFT